MAKDAKVIPITHAEDIKARKRQEIEDLKKYQGTVFDDEMRRLSRKLNQDFMALPSDERGHYCVVGEYVFVFRPRDNKTYSELGTRNEILMYGEANLVGVFDDNKLQEHPVSSLAELSEANVSQAVAMGCMGHFHVLASYQRCDFNAERVKQLLPSTRSS